uniref:Uncharacterized protein n=1 Tax=Panagrolaimus superbus TaxID=310955 RepID=A0A914YJ57_9BILA
MMSYTLWTDLRLAPTADPEYVIEDACLVVQADRIAWMGPRHDLPAQWQDATQEHKLGNRWVTPRADRLPHPSGLRRQPRPGICLAAGRGLL